MIQSHSFVLVVFLVQVGPGAALSGLLSIIVTDLAWEGTIFKSLRRYRSLVAGFLLFLLFLGLLPFIDNYAHIGGFIVGLLSASMFVPYFGQPLRAPTSQLSKDELRALRMKNILRVSVAFLSLLAYFIVLSIVFWVVQPECASCRYLNCIPLKKDYCRDLSHDLRSRLSYID